MPRENLIPYTLKLDKQMWNEIDDARTTLVGVLSPEGVSKKKFIETAIIEYLKYLKQELIPRIEKVKEETDLPVPFYRDNGVDLVW